MLFFGWLSLMMLAAIPVAVWNIVRAEKLKRENITLKQELKRLKENNPVQKEQNLISAVQAEVTPATVNKTEAPGAQEVPLTAQQAAVNAARPVTMQAAQSGQTAKKLEESLSLGAGLQSSVTPQQGKVNKKSAPANMLLITGVILITLAGLAFAVSSWHLISNNFKIGLLLGQSILFFAVAVLAHKGLKIKNTGVAFFTLGMLYLPIAIFGIGVLELFGRDFSFKYSPYTVMFAALFSLSAAAVAGAVIYKRRILVWSAFIGFALALSNLSRALFAADIAVLVITAYCAVFILLSHYFRQRHNFGNNNLASLFLRETKTIGALQLAATSVVFLFNQRGGMMSAFAAVIIGLLFLHPLFTKEIKLGGLGSIPAALYLFAGVWFMMSPNVAKGYPLLSLAAALIFIIDYMGVLPKKASKILSVSSSIFLLYYVYYILFAYNAVQIPWTIWRFAASVLLCAAALANALKGSKFFMLTSTIIMLNCIYGLTQILQLKADFFIVTGLAAFVLYLVHVFVVKRLRLHLSDALLIIMMLMSAILQTGAWQIVLLLLAVAALVIESMKYWGVGWLAVGVFLFLTPVMLQELPVNNNLNWLPYTLVMLVLIAVAAWLAFVNKKPHLARAFNWPVLITTPVYLFISSAIIVGERYLTITGTGRGPKYFFPTYSNMIFFFLRYLPALFAAVLMLINLISKKQVEPKSFKNRIAYTWLYSTVLISAVFSLSTSFTTHFAVQLSYALLGTVLAAFGAFAAVRQKKSVRSLPAVIALQLFLAQLYELILSNISSQAVGAAGSLSYYLGSIIIAVLFLIIGRFVCKGGFNLKQKQFDWFSIAAIFIILFSDIQDGYLYLALFALASTAFYARVYVKEQKSVRASKISLSLVLSFLAAAGIDFFYGFVLQDYRSILVMGIILFAAVINHLFIWRKKGSEGILFALSIITAISFITEAISGRLLVYALIVAILAFALLLLSYALRRKKWFIFAIITVLFVAVYITRSFWFSIAWWVYLLIAGALLITVGAINEHAKQKGAGLKTRAVKLFKNWQW